MTRAAAAAAFDLGLRDLGLDLADGQCDRLALRIPQLRFEERARLVADQAGAADRLHCDDIDAVELQGTFDAAARGLAFANRRATPSRPAVL